ncbi:unnamed protein product, partial [Trifolium pratense]
MNIQKNPIFEKFRNNELSFAHQLTTLFKDVVANGEYAWAQTSGILPPNVYSDNEADNDVYRPSLKNLGLDMEEGSSNSEDASVEATSEFVKVNLNIYIELLDKLVDKREKKQLFLKRKTKKKAAPLLAIGEAGKQIDLLFHLY